LNVFVKPNEQSQACLSYVMTRKRLNLFELYSPIGISANIMKAERQAKLV